MDAPAPESSTPTSSRRTRSPLPGWSRRRFLTALGATSIAVAAAPAALADVDHHGPGGRPGGFGGPGGRGERDGGRRGDGPIGAFYGEHQAGVTTPAQSQLVFTSMNVTSANRTQLVDLLRAWTQAAAGLVVARPESGLTLTLGFGP